MKHPFANNQTNWTQEKRTIWQPPWQFQEAIVILFSLLAIGFTLEWVTEGKGIGSPSWPHNLYIGLGLSSVIIFLHVFFRETYWCKFLRSTQNSISLIGSYLLIVILMGSFTQVDGLASPSMQRLGLSHITSSWPFLFLNTYFLIVLGLVTLSRLRPFSLRNCAFFVNHFGLWLAVFSGGIGSGDLQRLRMTVNTFDKQPVWYATDNNKTVELPSAIRLLKFSIEEYPPKITLIDNENGGVWADEGKNVFEVEQGSQTKLLNWNLKILRYLHESSIVGNRFYPVNELGAAPSAQVEIKSATTTDTAWISCGSFNRVPQAYQLDSAYSLVMTIPEPKKYQSDVVLYTPEGKIDTMLIEVNKAQTVSGYKLYQLSFDEKYGKWSETSILEVVKDPWQPVVYIGIFMMLFGGIYLFLLGSNAAQQTTTSPENNQKES